MFRKVFFITAVAVSYFGAVYCEECKNGDCDKNIREKYEPKWDSLDSRPLPQWYDDAKIGIFIHWGVYSVPSIGNEWFWIYWQGTKQEDYVNFMNKNNKPDFTYQEFAKDFTAELFNATEWAELFQDSGAKYVVITSKHHDGYALWPSKYTFSWNAKDVGPNRDIISELSSSIRETNSMHFGLYYSLYEWFNRQYIDDRSHEYLNKTYVENKVWPELKELITLFQPDVLWSDGDWIDPPQYWKSTEFLAWLYNESPVRDIVVTNDRWGKGTRNKHGGFHTGGDRYNPGVLQKHKWENAITIDKGSWGHRTNTKLNGYLTSEELIKELVTTISCGGNILVNVGPTRYGTIEAIFEERLRDMGKWLKTNGEAIYSTQPWEYQNDTVTEGVWYTAGTGYADRTIVYAMILNYPYDTNEISLYSLGGKTNTATKVTLLGFAKDNIKWSATEKSLDVKLPAKHVIDKVGLNFAWTLKIDMPHVSINKIRFFFLLIKYNL